MAFKQGDRIKCTNSGTGNLITEGKVYTVVRATSSHHTSERGVVVVGDSGKEGWFYNHRFELFTETETEQGTDNMAQQSITKTSKRAALRANRYMGTKDRLKDTIYDIVDRDNSGSIRITLPGYGPYWANACNFYDPDASAPAGITIGDMVSPNANYHGTSLNRSYNYEVLDLNITTGRIKVKSHRANIGDIWVALSNVTLNSKGSKAPTTAQKRNEKFGVGDIVRKSASSQSYDLKSNKDYTVLDVRPNQIKVKIDGYSTTVRWFANSSFILDKAAATTSTTPPTPKTDGKYTVGDILIADGGKSTKFVITDIRERTSVEHRTIQVRRDYETNPQGWYSTSALIDYQHIPANGPTPPTVTGFSLAPASPPVPRKKRQQLTITITKGFLFTVCPDDMRPVTAAAAIAKVVPGLTNADALKLVQDGAPPFYLVVNKVVDSKDQLIALAAELATSGFVLSVTEVTEVEV